MDTISIVLLTGLLVCAGLVFRGVWVYKRRQQASERLAATRLRMIEMAAHTGSTDQDASLIMPENNATSIPVESPDSVAGESSESAPEITPEPPSLNTPVVDVCGILEEAERQIRLGHLEDAARVLQKAVNRAPRQMELRFKLLEIHLAMGNESGVTQQEMDIEAVGNERDIGYCHQLIADHRNQSTVVNGD